MPLTGDDLAEQRHRLVLAHGAGNRHEPVGVVGFDAELAFPLRIGEVLVAFRRVFGLDQRGVERGGENAQPRRHPGTMRRHGLRDQIGEHRRRDLLQQLLAPQAFHFGAGGLGDIDIVTAAAMLGDGTAQNILRAAAPELDFDAVFFLERCRNGVRIVGDGRGIERDDAFFLGAIDQALGTVGTGEAGDIGDGFGSSRVRNDQTNDDREQAKHRSCSLARPPEAAGCRPPPRRPHPCAEPARVWRARRRTIGALSDARRRSRSGCRRGGG